MEESAYGVNVVFNNMAKSNRPTPIAVENIKIDKDNPSEDIEKAADNIVLHRSAHPCLPNLPSLLQRPLCAM